MLAEPSLVPDGDILTRVADASQAQLRARARVSTAENREIRTVMDKLSHQNSLDDQKDYRRLSSHASRFDQRMSYGMQRLIERRTSPVEVFRHPRDPARLSEDQRMTLRHVLFKVRAEDVANTEAWLGALDVMIEALRDHAAHITMVTIEDFVSESLLAALTLALPHVTYLDLANCVPLQANHIRQARLGWPKLLELHINLYPWDHVDRTRMCIELAQTASWGLEHLECWHCFEIDVPEYERLFTLATLRRLAFHNLPRVEHLRDVGIDWRYATSVKPGPILRHASGVYRDTFTMFLERVQTPSNTFTRVEEPAPAVSRWIVNPGLETHTAFGSLPHGALLVK